MKAVIVSYVVKPEFSDTNAGNIRAVMDEVRSQGHPGIRYQTFRLSEDGCSFRHIGFFADDEAAQTLVGLASFKRFQEQLRASGPVSPPRTEWLELVAAGRDLF